MAWEQQGSCRFFTLSSRVQGRVRRTYYGVGLVGEFAAAVVDLRRQSRQSLTAARLANRDHWDAASQCLQQAIAATDQLIAISLLIAGYRQHYGGEWRSTAYANHRNTTDPTTLCAQPPRLPGDACVDRPSPGG